MATLGVIILAAGKGTRMKSDLVKVLHPVAGTPMLALTLNLARSLRPDRVVVVVGFQRHLVRERFGAEDLLFVDQKEQLGTGHAVLTAGPAFKNFRGTVLILCGDVPLLTEKTVKGFIASHKEGGNTLSVLTTRLEDPTGYGRIFRGKKGQLVRIVEQKDLLAGEEKVREINTGIYCVEARFLFKALAGLSDQNAQKEYYLTDIVAQASSRGEKACAYLAEDSVEVMGINTRLDLAKASQYLRHKIAERHMLEGVTLMDPQTTYIDPGVEIGRDTVLYPNCYLAGKTSLGEKCLVESGCKITDTQVGNSVTIRSSSVITESIVEDRVEVGPFAHLRPQTLLRQGLRIGHGAGSTITKDVPAGCLAVSKVRQAHYKKRFQRKG